VEVRPDEADTGTDAYRTGADTRPDTGDPGLRGADADGRGLADTRGCPAAHRRTDDRTHSCRWPDSQADANSDTEAHSNTHAQGDADSFGQAANSGDGRGSLP